MPAILILDTIPDRKMLISSSDIVASDVDDFVTVNIAIPSSCFIYPNCKTFLSFVKDMTGNRPDRLNPRVFTLVCSVTKSRTRACPSLG